MKPDNTANLYTVSELNRAVAELLQHRFAWITVEGEISNLARPASGHLYFSLKDSQAQVRCAMFRGQNRQLRFRPENGQQVQVRARVSLYQPRGDYQLIIDKMEDAGDGALRRQFDYLKQQLASEGLFDSQHKRPLPTIPHGIGIVTSATGAAIRDALSVIERRFPAIPVFLYAVPVQGQAAPPAICKGLEVLDHHDACDVILLIRGGGSLEDLWAFNEEIVARSIHQCRTPVVTGIGHEIDVTIADFVADVRAATPSAAAETVTPEQTAWLQDFDRLEQRLHQLVNDHLLYREERLQWLHRRLQQQHPQQIIHQARSRLHSHRHRLRQAWRALLRHKQFRYRQSQTALAAFSPDRQLKRGHQQLHFLRHQLELHIKQILQNKQAELARQAHTLNAVSPLNTLERGYAIILDKNRRTLTRSDQVAIGETITCRLHRGYLACRVEKRE